jgi:hypothetical protein
MVCDFHIAIMIDLRSSHDETADTRSHLLPAVVLPHIAFAQSSSGVCRCPIFWDYEIRMRDSCRSDLKGLAEEFGFGIDFSAVVCAVSSAPNSQASFDILVVPVRRFGDTSRNRGMMRNLLRD